MDCNKNSNGIAKVLLMKCIFKILCAFVVIASGLSPAIAAEKPEIFVQLGHSGSIYSVAFSRDGRYAISAGGDRTIIWEVSTGKEIRSWNSSSSLAVSPDGEKILLGTGYIGYEMKLYDLSNGREINNYKGHSSPIESVALSPDGRYALSGSGVFWNSTDNTVRLWETSTGKEIRTFHGHSKQVHSVTFSPDGRHILSCSDDKTIKLWDIATGGEIRSITVGEFNTPQCVTFSPDGRFVVTGTYSGEIIILEVSTGKEMRRFKGHSLEVKSVVFSPDGTFVLSGSRDGTMKLWEASNGREIKVFKGHAYDVNSVNFSSDGRYALSGSDDMTMKLWDVAAGSELRTFSRDIVEIPSVACSPDGRSILSPFGRSLYLWDIVNGKRDKIFAGHTDRVVQGAFSSDGKYAISGSGSYGGIADNSVRLWDISTGKGVVTFSEHSNGITGVALSPDGQYALSSSFDKTMKIWEISTGRDVRTFQGSFFCVSFSQDGKSLMATKQDTTDAFKPKTSLKIYETKTGREIRSFEIGSIIGVSYSSDKRYILTGYHLELIEVATGKKIRTFSRHGHTTMPITFSPDTQYFATGDGDIVKLWNIPSGVEVRRFTGHSGNVNYITFSPDGRYIVSGGADGTIRLWDIPTGREIARFVSFIDGEWIVITPEGYYNSSANGDKHLNVRIGNNVYGIDQYRSAFYKPQIVEAALRLGDTQKAIAETIGVDKEKPAVTVASIQNIEPPFIVIKSPEDGKKMSSSDAEISLYIEDRNQTIKNVKVYINGRQVTGSEIASPSARNDKREGTRNDIRGIKITPKGIEVPEGKKTLDLKVPVSLDIGENLIEVMASNGFSEGRKSIRIYSGDEKKAAKGEVILPNLWILSIGINRYQDKNLTPLSYAVADSEGIVEAFNSQKGKLFREIKSLTIHDNSSIKPSRDNITDNLDYVKKAGHNDVVILFIAGHGINDDSGEFYFLPSDAVISEDGSIKKSKAISWRDIKAILDIPAKKIIFADTCHSEGVSGKKTRGVDNDRFVKELQEANAVIFTSSRGRELSQEADKWRHGAFTYALIEGIKGKANLIKDNKISMKELDTYVSETVPQLTNGAQHPITNTPDGYVNFPVALVE
jgi:WD40 repeat protein